MNSDSTIEDVKSLLNDLMDQVRRDVIGCEVPGNCYLVVFDVKSLLTRSPALYVASIPTYWRLTALNQYR